MNTKVFMDALHDANDDFSAMSRSMANIMQILETVERELHEQSEFQEHIHVLRRIEETIQEELRKLRTLGEAVDQISRLYQYTDVSIDNSFDGRSTRQSGR